MLKVYKGYNPMYGMGEPVKISNKVNMPVPVEDDNKETDVNKPTEEELRLQELKKAEEERKKEAERKIEMERRINEEAEAKLKQFLVRRNDSLEKERTEIIEKAKREASAITADAKVTTMTVIKKAESESLKLREEARREGHDQGYAEGRTESLEKYKKYIDAAGKLLAEINSRKEAYYISSEEEMRETVFDLVRKVIGVELKTNPQIIDGIIGEAAKNFRNSDYIKITLPDDEISERYITDKKLIRDIIPYIPEIEIEFDGEVEEGTVIIDDGSEIVDAGIPTQLDFLKEILRNTRGEATEDEANFMEEIKGRAHRRKSITISADDNEPASRTGQNRAAVEPEPEIAVEPIVDMAEPEIIAEPAVSMAAVETEPEPEIMPIDMAEPAIEPEPEIAVEPIVNMAAVETESEPEIVPIDMAEPVAETKPAEETVPETKPAAEEKPAKAKKAPGRSRKKAAKPEAAEPIAEAAPAAEAAVPAETVTDPEAVASAAETVTDGADMLMNELIAESLTEIAAEAVETFAAAASGAEMGSAGETAGAETGAAGSETSAAGAETGAAGSETSAAGSETDTAGADTGAAADTETAEPEQLKIE